MARAATNSWSSRSRKTVTYQQVVAALRGRVQSPCLTPRSPRSDEHGARCIRRWPTARQLASNDPQQGPADAVPRSAFRWSAASYPRRNDTTVIPLGRWPEPRHRYAETMATCLASVGDLGGTERLSVSTLSVPAGMLRSERSREQA